MDVIPIVREYFLYFKEVKMKYQVITIGHEYGSGGREIGNC